MSADAVMEVFERAADAVAEVLASTSDWGPSGLRHSQYAFDVTADDACRAVLHGAGLAVLSEESGATAPDGSTVSADRPVVVVDDVLNTGSTLMYAVTHFLSLSLKMLQTAVLVNRNHKKFPIKGDFKGISLSTAVKEHISVEFGENEGVYLS